MGCFSSSDASQKIDKNLDPSKRPPDDVLYTYVDENSPKLAYDFIIKEATSFLCTSFLVPSVCLTHRAFPLINAKLPLDETGQSSIELPVVSCAFAGEKGRVMCFPHGEVLEDISDHSTTAHLFQRALSWLAHQKSTMTPILLLGFDPEFTSSAKSVLHTYGFFVEDSQRLARLNAFRVVLIPSTFDTFNQQNFSRLLQFVENGGGLAVFFWPLNDENNSLSFPINKLLLHFGLSYTFCSIDENDTPIGIQNNYEESQEHHFHRVIKQMETMLSKKDIDPTELDNIVTTVKYNVLVSGDGQKDQMKELGHICYSYLFEEGFAKDNIFNPDLKQIIILYFLQDIVSRLPVESITAVPGHEAFPGECEEDVNGDDSIFNLEIDVVDEAWISTGLYLPAGVVGTVITEQPYPNLHIQVGAHHESLIQKTPPWKRWPSVVSAFTLSSTDTKIASPWGGPVYIAASEQLEGNVKVNFTFQNFAKYPLASKNDPLCWENTKDKRVPFGEIECDHIILSMPTEYLKELDFDRVTHVVDTLASSISKFMCYNLVRQFRVVFDIDLTENGASYGYPIVVSTNEILPMFKDLEKPSMELFTLCNLIGIVTIPEGCFDSTIEAALAACAASVAFRELYKNFDPIEFASKTLQPLFTEFWKITTSFEEEIIPLTLKKFQDPEYEITGVPEDTWIEFVREMCRIGHRDFTKILEQSRPIPLNVTVSCHNFPPFNPDEAALTAESSPLVCQ